LPQAGRNAASASVRRGAVGRAVMVRRDDDTLERIESGGRDMKMVIEYCARWNYKPRAAGLAEQLQGNFGAEVELQAGSGGVFEVYADGRCVFSKKEQGRFPNEGEIVSLLKQ